MRRQGGAVYGKALEDLLTQALSGDFGAVEQLCQESKIGHPLARRAYELLPDAYKPYRAAGWLQEVHIGWIQFARQRIYPPFLRDPAQVTRQQISGTGQPWGIRWQVAESQDRGFFSTPCEYQVWRGSAAEIVASLPGLSDREAFFVDTERACLSGRGIYLVNVSAQTETLDTTATDAFLSPCREWLVMTSLSKVRMWNLKHNRWGPSWVPDRSGYRSHEIDPDRVLIWWDPTHNVLVEGFVLSYFSSLSMGGQSSA